jgi:hypothetical protein
MQPVKQDGNDSAPKRNQSSHDTKLDEPMRGKLRPCEQRALCISSRYSAERVVSRFARFRICRRNKVVPRGTSLDPSRSSVVGQKKQR